MVFTELIFFTFIFWSEFAYVGPGSKVLSIRATKKPDKTSRSISELM